MAEQQDGTQGDGGGAEAGETPTFDGWLATQDAATKALLDKHTAGLKSALDDEKSTRKQLARQIAELSRQAEEGSALKAALEKASGEYAQTSRKAAFYEGAPSDVSNMKLAWLAANDAGLVDKDGVADWATLRKQAPELFRKALTPPGNAGNGAGQTGPGTATMNDFIRKSAGRG